MAMTAAEVRVPSQDHEIRDALLGCEVRKAVGMAIARFDPLASLPDETAANPFAGITRMSFTRAVAHMAAVGGSQLTMPRRFYAEALRQGVFGDDELATAIAEHDWWQTRDIQLADLRQAMLSDGPNRPALTTVAEIASHTTGMAYERLVANRISHWAGRYLDEETTGESRPATPLSAYQAWRSQASRDPAPELMGLAGFRNAVAALPEDADELLGLAVSRLCIDSSMLDLWFHRQLMSVAGWAYMACFGVTRRNDVGLRAALLAELLAVRVSWDLLLFEHFRNDRAFLRSWNLARNTPPADIDKALVVDVLLQRAYELGWQRRFAALLLRTPAQEAAVCAHIQVALPMDLRAEPLRRALESLSPALQTIEFSGLIDTAPQQDGAAADFVEQLLRSMSMTRNFARLLVLTTTIESRGQVLPRHTPTSAYTSILGHAATLLNDAAVRVHLAERGITIPPDSWFVAAVYDIGQATISLQGNEAEPVSHGNELQALRELLRIAGRRMLASRAQQQALIPYEVLPPPVAPCGCGPHCDSHNQAACTAFIAGPRSRTRHLDFSGRVFLHDYDWHTDQRFATLEALMAGALVNATHKSLQYFGHVVNGTAVAGNTTCVASGPALTDDESSASPQPLRLSVFIDAPVYAIDMVLNKYRQVWELVGNGWVHLFAFMQSERRLMHYVPSQGWRVFSAPAIEEDNECGGH